MGWFFSLNIPLSAQTNNTVKIDDYGTVSDFTLTDRSGRTVSKKDLQGQFWIADFIFTRCSGPCPLLTNRMALLQKELPKEVRLVSITVDPEYDTPNVLSWYAERYGADRERWLFLTGQKKEVYSLIRQGFHIGVEESGSADPGNAFIHSTLFALVDPQGVIRAIYHGDDWEDLRQAVRDYKMIALKQNHPIVVHLPWVNAALNATCCLFLLTGLQLIRARNITLHKACMLTAFLISIAFLVSYLTYHYYAGSIPYQGQGPMRDLYFFILISHTILAAIVPPLALVTLYQAWKANFQKHVRIAHWTFPIWLYVSVTGVVIYGMLYH